MGELVLITGTSSGIGLSAAIECASAGHKVVATMRNIDKREALVAAAKARSLSIDVEQLDVTARDVGDTVRNLVLKYGPFYGLVNNAGIAVGGPFEEQSEDDVRQQFETNVLGLMAVTRAFLPSMRGASRGRIINVSSISGHVAMPCLSVYAATKHAVEGFSEGLRWELFSFGIDVCVVAPGTHQTPIFQENERRGAFLSMDGPYAALNRRIEALVQERLPKAPPADDVGRAICELIDKPMPPFRTVIGREALTMKALRGVMPDRLFALGLRRALGLSRSR